MENLEPTHFQIKINLPPERFELPTPGLQDQCSAPELRRLVNLQSLGNHEFDEGIEGLLPFLEAANFPVLVSNIQTDQEPQMIGKTSKSLVIEVGGRKIGIIGYLFPDTTVISFETICQ